MDLVSEPWRPDPACGVFETMLVVAGAPIELHAHLARLARSLAALFAANTPASARGAVLSAAKALALGRLRLTVAPAKDGQLAATVSTAAVAEQDLFPGWERAVALRSFTLHGGLGPHKWADRSALADMEAQCQGGCLPLLLDGDEVVLEASRANLFTLQRGVLATPPDDGRILAGVARARVIEAARSLGLAVAEQELSRAALQSGGEAFLSGSVRGVEPVRSLDGTALKAPGEEVAAIASQIRREWVDMVARR